MGIYFIVRCSRLSLSLLLLPLPPLLNGDPMDMVLLPVTHLTMVADLSTTLEDPQDLTVVSPSPLVPLDPEVSALLTRAALTSVLPPRETLALTSLLLIDKASALLRDLNLISKVLSRRPQFTVKRRSTPSTVLSSVTLVPATATVVPSLAAVLPLITILTSTSDVTPNTAVTSATVVTELDLSSTPQDSTVMSATTSVAPTDTNPALTSAMASVVISPATALSLSPILTSTTDVTPITAATMATVVLLPNTAVDISAMPSVPPLTTPITNRVTSTTDVEAMVLAPTVVLKETSISTVDLPAAHPFKAETSDSVVVDTTSDLAVASSLMLATNTVVPTLSVPAVTVPLLSDSAVLHVLTATRVDSTAVSVLTTWTKLEISASEELREMLPSMPHSVPVLPIVFLLEARLLSLLRIMMVILPLELTMLAELSLRLEHPMTLKLVLPNSEPSRLISTRKLLMFLFQLTALTSEPLMTKLARALWMMSKASPTPALMIFSQTQLNSANSLNSMPTTTRVDSLPTALSTTSSTMTTTLLPRKTPRTITLTVVTSTKPITVIMISMMTIITAALMDSAVSRTTHLKAAPMEMEDATLRTITTISTATIAALMDNATLRSILTTTVLFTVAIAAFTDTAATTDIADTATTDTDTTDTDTTVTALTDTATTATA